MREIMIKVPGWETAYDLHQIVWACVRKHLGDGTWFLYRAVGDLVKIRHEKNLGRPVLLPEAGKVYELDVMANLLKSSTRLGGKIPVSDKNEALAMLRRRLEDVGVEPVRLDGRFVPGPMFGKPGHANFRLRAFLCHGLVEVHDEAGAVWLLRHGIGRARRFGFGMIDLRSAS